MTVQFSDRFAVHMNRPQAYDSTYKASNEDSDQISLSAAWSER